MIVKWCVIFSTKTDLFNDSVSKSKAKHIFFFRFCIKTTRFKNKQWFGQNIKQTKQDDENINYYKIRDFKLLKTQAPNRKFSTQCSKASNPHHNSIHMGTYRRVFAD